LLGRLVDVGTELFAISAVCSRAQHLLQTDGDADSLMPLVEQVCRDAIRRIETAFRDVCCNDDRRRYRLARDVLEKRYSWLEDGIVAEWPGKIRAPGDDAPASDVAKNRHAES
jgi:hypothetical protein